MHRSRVVALVLAAALALAACSGGGKKKSDSSDTIDTSDAPAQQGPAQSTTPTSTTTTASASAAPGRQIAAPWPAPTSDIADLIEKAGLPQYTEEKLTVHYHAHLDVYVDGQAQAVPPGLGIDNDAGVISPLHTHDSTGLIHIESDKDATFRLGQLMVEWNIRLDGDCAGSYCKPAKDVAVYVDGKKHDGDPRQIEFTKHGEIAIVIGRAPKDIPSNYDFPANT